MHSTPLKTDFSRKIGAKTGQKQSLFSAYQLEINYIRGPSRVSIPLAALKKRGT